MLQEKLNKLGINIKLLKDIKFFSELIHPFTIIYLLSPFALTCFGTILSSKTSFIFCILYFFIGSLLSSFNLFYFSYSEIKDISFFNFILKIIFKRKYMNVLSELKILLKDDEKKYFLYDLLNKNNYEDIYKIENILIKKEFSDIDILYIIECITFLIERAKEEINYINIHKEKDELLSKSLSEFKNNCNQYIVNQSTVRI